MVDPDHVIVTRAPTGILHALAIGERMTRSTRAGTSRHGSMGRADVAAFRVVALSDLITQQPIR